MNEAKEILRTEALRHRGRIMPDLEDAEAVIGHFFKALAPEPGAIIAGYWPRSQEFDVRPLLDELVQKGFRCALPVMQAESRELKFAAWNPNMELRKGPFGVMQPPVDENTSWAEPDIVITPMLAFDRRGYRLGHGYGYYDATLRALRARKKITAVGLAYAQQAVLFNLPVEEHDERLDCVITPEAIRKFDLKK